MITFTASLLAVCWSKNYQLPVFSMCFSLRNQQNDDLDILGIIFFLHCLAIKTPATEAALKYGGWTEFCKSWDDGYQITPRKTNIEPENGPLEKEIPFGNHPF